MQRGAQVLDCEGKRDLAVYSFDEQWRLIDEWMAARVKRNKPWWKPW